MANKIPTNIMSTVAVNSDDTKVIYEMECYILCMGLLVIILLLLYILLVVLLFAINMQNKHQNKKVYCCTNMNMENDEF